MGVIMPVQGEGPRPDEESAGIVHEESDNHQVTDGGDVNAESKYWRTKHLIHGERARYTDEQVAAEAARVQSLVPENGVATAADYTKAEKQAEADDVEALIALFKESLGDNEKWALDHNRQIEQQSFLEFPEHFRANRDFVLAYVRSPRGSMVWRDADAILARYKDDPEIVAAMEERTKSHHRVDGGFSSVA